MADVLNDAAIFLDLLAPFFLEFFLLIMCLSSITRVSLTVHLLHTAPHYTIPHCTTLHYTTLHHTTPHHTTPHHTEWVYCSVLSSSVVSPVHCGRGRWGHQSSSYATSGVARQHGRRVSQRWQSGKLSAPLLTHTHTHPPVHTCT